MRDSLNRIQKNVYRIKPMMEVEMSNLSKMLKLYLAVSDIEQKQLASVLGMSESSLTRLLQGHDVEMKSFANIVKWLSEDTAPKPNAILSNLEGRDGG